MHNASFHALFALGSLATLAIAVEPPSGGARVAAAACVPTTASSFSSSPALPISASGSVTVSDTITVSGAGTYLWDVDLTTDIPHTYGGDLDIKLMSPSGNEIVITTDNAGTLDNTFAGTLWDAQANDPPTDHAFANLVVATPLSPEGSLDAFRGEDPNGAWTLTVTDDENLDGGVLNSWTLDLHTLGAAPGETTTSLSRSPNLRIPPAGSIGTTTDTLTVSGIGTQISKLALYLEAPHAAAWDLDITLTAPSGTTVTVTTDNASNLDNVFDGTWFDPDGTDPTTDHVYTNLVVATPLTPEGSFGNFIGLDPNGVWTLTVVDDKQSDIGTLERWDLRITTCGASAPVVYCGPIGPTLGGCTADIAATGNPDVGHTNACVVTVSNVDPNRTGIVFYSVTGSQSAQWCGTGIGNSFLCVLSPTVRSLPQNSGGGALACDGDLVLDWNAFQIGNPGFPGQPFASGDKAWVQGWFRDPASCRTTFLSEAIELTYQ